MDKHQIKQANRKQRRRIVSWIAVFAVVSLLAAMPMLASGNGADAGDQASILSASAAYQNVDTRIVGGGQLASEASIRVRLPEEVKITEYLVGNGDTVSEGEPIAAVDKVSVMTAITGVQETLDYLSDEIAGASDEKAPDTVKALSGGTVKAIYAEEGKSVQDVMLEHGALAVLSLDDTMAVQLEVAWDSSPGDTARVVFADGSEADGRVKSNQNGILIVTIEDKDYAIGTQVTVETEDGQRLGSGALYVFSPWNAAAYSGTIADIRVHEGDTVYVGQTLMKLSDPGNSAEYQRLIDQRHEYEELMQELFRMYRTETITAPCDGIVTGVDQDGAFLLADTGEGLVARLLSFFEESGPEGFVACTAKVASVSDQGMELLLNPDKISVSDLTDISHVSAGISGMTQNWHYTGDPTVYIQTPDGLLQPAGTAREGDVLLAVGDSGNVYWFVVLTGSDSSAAARTDSSGNSIRVRLLSDSDTGMDGENTGVLAVPLVSGVFMQSGNENLCTGQADCTADTHNPGCLSQQSAPPQGSSISIITASLNSGVAGQSYTSPLQASDGTDILSGTWAASGLPGGLTIDGTTGIISGTPNAAGSYAVTVSFTYNDTPVVKDFTLDIAKAAAQTVYRGYAAQIVQIVDGAAQVKQTEYSYTITDLNNLPTISADTGAMTIEKTYTGSQIRGADFAAQDIVLIVVDENGTLVHISKANAASGGGTVPGGSMPGMGSGGMDSGEAGSGRAPSGGGMSGTAGGMGQTQAFALYSLDKLTIASVTSQEHMTLDVTVDELDITKLYIGQAATITIDALGGESFSATVSQISNSGTNEGGNSKFTVELTLEKSGEMLPGMRASASVRLSTAENALCVPVAALGEENGETVLYTSYDEEKALLGSPVSVTIGIADAEYVQILEGISEGDSVYYPYYDTLSEQDRPSAGAVSFGDIRRTTKMLTRP